MKNYTQQQITEVLEPIKERIEVPSMLIGAHEKVDPKVLICFTLSVFAAELESGNIIIIRREDTNV